MTTAALDSLPRTAVPLMPTRYAELQAAMASYEKSPSAPALIGLSPTDSGATYRALGATDDAGLYYILPKLAQIFHLSVNDAWTLWFFTILLLSLAVGIYGMTRFLKSPIVKILYLVQLIGLIALVVKIGDVYQLAPCLAIAALPLVLQFASRPIDDKKFLRGVALFGAAGAAFGIAHSIRSHSATGLMLFIAALALLAAPLILTKRFILVSAMVGGFLLPQFYMKTVLDARDAFLKERLPSYNAALRQHPFWHTVYIGFGFLNNDYGISYKDEAAAAKVRSIEPQAEYCSPLYEETLKRSVIDLVKSDPVFAFSTIAAKLGVIGVYFILAANIGLLAALRYPKKWSVELAFLAALGFNALFGILVMPRLSYLSGFLAFAMLYGIVSLDHAVLARSSEKERKLVGQEE